MSDEIYAEVVELLYGPGSELIAKMNPTQSDIAAHQDRRKRAFTAGLSAVGASAGAAGLALGGHNLRRSYNTARYGLKAGQTLKQAKKAGGALKPVLPKKQAVKAAVGKEKLATGLIPLEVAGLGGELMATKILHGDTKKKPVSKGAVEAVEQASFPTKRSLTQAVVTNPKVRAKSMEVTRKGAGKLQRLPDKVLTTHKVEKKMKTRSRAESIAGHGAMGMAATGLPMTISRKYAGTKAHAAALGIGAGAGAAYGALKPVTHPQEKKVKKNAEVDVLWEGEFAKADADKQQLFGWASVVEIDGTPVVDLQGDLISIDEMERAGYEYVMKSRKGGDMHLRDEWQPVQKSEMIESFIVTPEKREAMGLPDSVPSGWWVGFQVRDPQVWAKVRNGERTGFSIHGHGRRSDA